VCESANWIILPTPADPPTDAINGVPGLTFGDVISAAPMGELFDDISNFWQPPRYENQFALSYVKVGANGPVDPPESGHLQAVNGTSARAICTRLYAQRDSEPGEAGSPETEVRPVPLKLVCAAFCRIAGEEEFEWDL
jgi:hypothetical protein